MWRYAIIADLARKNVRTLDDRRWRNQLCRTQQKFRR
jgi:hypothetical protein